MFLAPVNVVLELDANLPFGRLVANEWMLEQMLCVRALVIILDQHCLNEILELFGPFLRLEARRRIARDQKEGAHRVHVAQRRLTFGHLEGRDAQAPQITSIVVSRLRVVLAGNHFGRHPVRRPNERVAAANRPIQLGTYTKIHYKYRILLLDCSLLFIFFMFLERT